MRRSRATTIVALVLFASAAAAVFAHGPKADARGVWLVEDEDAYVEVRGCGQSLCGEIVYMFEPHDDQGNIKLDINNPDEAMRSREIVGLNILEGMSSAVDRKGFHTGGRIYDPKNGKTYRAKMKLTAPDRLEIRGFIGVSLIGRTTVWTRVPAKAVEQALGSKR